MNFIVKYSLDLLIILWLDHGYYDLVLVEQVDKYAQYLNWNFHKTKKNILYFLPGHDRTSFSTNCFPINPVAPVIKIDFRLKNSAMPLVSVLADISE